MNGEGELSSIWKVKKVRKVDGETELEKGMGKES